MNAPENWQSHKLHHWSMLAMLYGEGPPVDLEENLPGLDMETRLARVSEILGLSAAQPELIVHGPGDSGRATINHRLIDKMRDDAYAKRTPFIPWAPYAVTRAIEVWRQIVTPKHGGPPELRTFYLAPLASSAELESYLAISGEDGVVFNIMRADANYTNNIRSGDLLFARPTSPCLGFCCARYVEMRKRLIQLNAKVLQLQQQNRRLRERQGRRLE